MRKAFIEADIEHYRRRYLNALKEQRRLIKLIDKYMQKIKELKEEL